MSASGEQEIHSDSCINDEVEIAPQSVELQSREMLTCRQRYALQYRRDSSNSLPLACHYGHMPLLSNSFFSHKCVHGNLTGWKLRE